MFVYTPLQVATLILLTKDIIYCLKLFTVLTAGLLWAVAPLLSAC